ncbi:MAG: hypothetical protein ABRQ27_06940 [Clostridiaceae bacterium]
MDDNKNRVKDREKSNAELRKMYPQGGEDVGIKDGEKIGHYANSKNHRK